MYNIIILISSILLHFSATDNKIADERKLKRLQQMSCDPMGFSMDTQITAERRKTILNSVLSKCDKRQKEMDALMK
jgi:hypothetical protein